MCFEILRVVCVFKACYRSMGTTGDPVTGRPAVRTGEPLHRLEPVPVNPITQPNEHTFS
jgi:hypothetical protein